MHLKNLKHITSLGLAIVLMTSPATSTMVNAKTSTTELTITDSDGECSKQLLEDTAEKIENQVQSAYDPEEEVTVIVQLKEDSLLEQFTETADNSSETFEEFATSDEAQDHKQELEETQEQVIDDMSAAKDIQGKDVLYQYTVVMNGFAIKVPYKELENIQKMSKVDKAYVAPVYEMVEPTVTNGASMVGATETWDLDIKGEGTVVAVLDTGLDTSHEAFQEEVTTPKVTKDTIASLMSETPFNATATSVDQVYVNEKVPFAYDYADNDCDVNPTEESVVNGNSHGTHVAGIVGAQGDIEGVAPEAQLMVLKVFPDKETGAATEDILAALEDAVSLGADVINMSLGSTNGFTDEGEESVEKVYDSITNAGISLAISAGNSASSSENNGLNGNALSSNPDTAVVGSPSTYTAATSVASVINSKTHSDYFTVGDEKILYSETASGTEPKLSSLAQNTLSYVMVPGAGETSDYEGIDVKGKVAVVSRGSITFTQKVANAHEQGAVAIIIYNNQDGTISMSIQEDDYKIPAVSITKADGLILEKESEKEIIITGEKGVFDNEAGYQVSSFSSWGVSPNLDLKPEIAAPGENIYSTIPFNEYGNMSGTSMAAPHVAGTYALIRQYINGTDTFDNLSVIEKGNLMTQLLMSTAIPTEDENKVLYSPRKQGSGVVNIYNAINTKAYLYVDSEQDQNGKPKLNLYDDPDKKGVFEDTFHIKNTSKDSVTYTVNNVSLVEKLKEDSEFLAESSKEVSDDVKITVTVNGKKIKNSKITVAPGKDVIVKVTFKIGKSLKKYYEENFENGEFFEGYVVLESAKDGIDLSIPYLGFYGDWTKAPIFDRGSVNDFESYSQTYHALYTNGGNNFMGINMFDENAYMLRVNEYNPYYYLETYQKETLTPSTKKIAISPNGDGYFDSLDIMQLSLLRNAKEVSYQIVDNKNRVLLEGKQNYVTKTSYSSSVGTVYPTFLEVNFDGKNTKNKVLSNNTECTLKIQAKLDYDQHKSNNEKDTISIPITIDTQAPSIKRVILKQKDEKTTLQVKVKDNQYVSYVSVLQKDENGEYKEIAGQTLNESKKGKESTVTLDLSSNTDILGKGKEVVIACYDYAANVKEVKVKAVH